MIPLPKAPWESLSADFCGPLPSGDYIMVVKDDFSRYPEVEILTTTSARAVIPKMDKIFVTHGIHSVVKTDNGPPFNSEHFAKFARYLGFKHKITRLWPEENGETERFMRTLKKYLQTNSSGTWKQTLWQFLRSYRATPYSSTGIPPATAVFGHNIRTQLPTIFTNIKSKVWRKMKENDEKYKQYQKTYADKKRHTMKSYIKCGIFRFMIKNSYFV